MLFQPTVSKHGRQKIYIRLYQQKALDLQCCVDSFSADTVQTKNAFLLQTFVRFGSAIYLLLTVNCPCSL